MKSSSYTTPLHQNHVVPTNYSKITRQQVENEVLCHNQFSAAFHSNQFKRNAEILIEKNILITIEIKAPKQWIFKSKQQNFRQRKKIKNKTGNVIFSMKSTQITATWQQSESVYLLFDFRNLEHLQIHLSLSVSAEANIIIIRTRRINNSNRRLKSIMMFS